MKLNYILSLWNYEAYAEPETLEEAVADARRAGYGVELWPSFKRQKDLFAPENRERIVRLLQDVPSSLHAGAADTFEEHKIQIEAARDTGSTVIVVHADWLGLRESSRDYGLARDVVACGSENGVTIALENGVGQGNLDELTHALEAVSGLRVCLDIGHVYVAHDHPIREYLDRLSSHIAHLHLQDVYLVPGTRRAKSDSHRPPGQCDIPLADWQRLFSTLEKIDYKGFAVIEVRPFTPVEVASQTAEFLEPISE
jgi:sugar phosphate isomerase/epimerase